jgi:hypothetical protein
MEGARSMEGTRLDTQACAGQNPNPPHPALAFLSLDLPVWWCRTTFWAVGLAWAPTVVSPRRLDPPSQIHIPRGRRQWKAIGIEEKCARTPELKEECAR